LRFFRTHTGVDYFDVNRDGLEAIAKKLGVETPNGIGKAEIADYIYKNIAVRKSSSQHLLCAIHWVTSLLPNRRKKCGTLANFQLVICGYEIVNAFSELNDPLEQARRFEEQEAMFKKGFEEAQRSDKEYIEAMEYGMPPAAGFGMGIDRLQRC